MKIFQVAIARASNFTILTQDKGYGKLVFKSLIEDPPAIVLFRFPKDTDPGEAGRRLESLMKEGIVIEGRFTVVDEKDWRQKTYEALPHPIV
jgi:hypothetical protein